MAGFLDKQTRIIDMVLTAAGRNLLSRGKLNFTYWMSFDDEIDYQPFISQSGTMTALQFSSSLYDEIESTPIREAVAGYQITNMIMGDTTNVIRPLYTMPQGQATIPRMTSSGGPTGSVGIQV